MAGQQIVVSAVVMRDERGRILTVRKKGTQMFMFPGGKPEAGETSAQAAVRETSEEVGLALDLASLVPLGRFEAAAANEAGCTVIAEVFAHPLAGAPAASSEIAEIAWVDPSDSARPDIAPLLRDAVFPRLLANS